jgi:hypothetical protein
MDQEFDTPLCLALGNRKVGRVWTFSLPSVLTCPGATAWCRAHCYARRIERLRPNCRRAYGRNLSISLSSERFVERVLDDLPADATHVRIHVGGDFYDAAYIESWRRICLARPNTFFWTYTRSWIDNQLRPALEKLRALPNVQIFASVDPGMPPPPMGWRAAYLDIDPRAKGLPCPHQQDQVDSCRQCGYCFRPRTGDVIFTVH